MSRIMARFLSVCCGIFISSADATILSKTARKILCANQSVNNLLNESNCTTERNLIQCMSRSLKAGHSSLWFATNNRRCCQKDMLFTIDEVHAPTMCLYDTKSVNCPIGFNYETQTRQCFKYFPANSALDTYEKVTTACRNAGGTGLVLIESLDEHNVIAEYLLKNVSPLSLNTLIQGRRTHGTWRDDGGKPLLYFNWNVARGEPDGSGNNAVLRDENLKWHDYSFSIMPFICESSYSP